MEPAERYKYIEYQKYKFTAEWFTQLTNQKAAEGKEARNAVLRTKIGYGFLGMYNKEVGLSPFERFYMGGSGISGFQNFVAREIIGLRGYPDNSISSTVGDPIVARYTLELRYPVSLNPQATIFLLGFAEAGNTWRNFRSFNPFDVKRSAGFGMRVFLPMFGIIWGFFTPKPGCLKKPLMPTTFRWRFRMILLRPGSIGVMLLLNWVNTMRHSKAFWMHA